MSTHPFSFSVAYEGLRAKALGDWLALRAWAAKIAGDGLIPAILAAAVAAVWFVVIPTLGSMGRDAWRDFKRLGPWASVSPMSIVDGAAVLFVFAIACGVLLIGLALMVWMLAKAKRPLADFQSRARQSLSDHELHLESIRERSLLDGSIAQEASAGERPAKRL